MGSTKATIATLIDNNLADNSDIIPSEHRAVEDALNDSSINNTETDPQTMQGDLVLQNATLADDKVLAQSASMGTLTTLRTFEANGLPIASFKTKNAEYRTSLDTATGSYNVTDSSDVVVFKVTDAGVVSMMGYGAGDAQFLAGGVLTSVSDSKFKDPTRSFEYGLEEVKAINEFMTFFNFNELSGYDTSEEYASFLADKVAGVMPEAAPLNVRYVKDAEGNDTEEIDKQWHSLAGRVITMAQNNAICEISAQIDALNKRLDDDGIA